MVSPHSLSFALGYLQPFRFQPCYRFIHFFLCFTVLTVISSYAPTTRAELYKWQDEVGNWHFSDKPPRGNDPDHLAPHVERISTYDNDAQDSSGDTPSDADGKSQQALDTDLAAKLAEKFPDTSPIAQVTLAVVAIETPMGSGSGFFITSDGLIVTNKHVVRPSKTAALDKTKSKIARTKIDIEKRERDLAQERDRLERFDRQLKDRKKYLDSKGMTNSKSLAEEEYLAYKERYDRRKRDYEQAQNRHQSKKREFDKMVAEFNFKSSLSDVARRFKVFLKDDSEHQATLVALSDKYDLALLKLSGAHTPTLTLASVKKLSQGSNVFAIGSPLGLRDSVTKGIITGYRNHFVVTDTQILPGNSGGPLVTESGQVIGVNTLKLAQEANRQGFGLAIPITTVQKEFRRHLLP
ncbi:MAG: trypsin-like peptidase domain-containing protein [Gammaproteobacteria bacterium]